MPRICYVPKRFGAESQAIIDRANAICAEYQAAGYDLTLRQLYYQFVARGIIPNNMKSYKRLGNIVNDARMAGEMDWNYINDRTRNLQSYSTWTSPAGIIDSAAYQFALDKWAGQPTYVEVWVEKEALAGVVGQICRTLQVPYFSCRGYVSQSEQWQAGQRLGRKLRSQDVLILHLGDHDPSGIDMSRDNRERLELFVTHHHGSAAADRLELKRIALNMDQIEQYDPPPNPAKLTDSRANNYIAEFGDDSWELDALTPQVITALIQDEVDAVRDMALWDLVTERERRHKADLQYIADNWDEVAALVRADDDDETDD